MGIPLSKVSAALALPEEEIIRKGVISLLEKEIRLAEEAIAAIRERYDVLSKEELYEAIKSGRVVEHPAWEDYIVWKNKEAHIARLRELLKKEFAACCYAFTTDDGNTRGSFVWPYYGPGAPERKPGYNGNRG